MKKTKRKDEVQSLRSKKAAPNEVSPWNAINCAVCNALLPHDVGFQEFHMQKMHGLVV